MLAGDPLEDATIFPHYLVRIVIDSGLEPCTAPHVDVHMPMYATYEMETTQGVECLSLTNVVQYHAYQTWIKVGFAKTRQMLIRFLIRTLLTYKVIDLY